MRKIIIITMAFVAISCSNDEITIDNSITDADFLIQRQGNSLELLDFTNNSIILIDLSVKIGKIDLIKRFRGKYYLLNKTENRIFVLESISSAIISEIDLSANDNKIKDFCFPNATDCYIIYENVAKVGIIDLMFNKLTNVEIELSGVASDIAGIGNQVYVTIADNSVVEVIDTRTNLVYSQISVSNKPVLVDFAANGKVCIVICMENDTITPTKINIIDLETAKLTKSMVLTGKDNIAADIIPTAITISDKFIYLSATTKTNISAGGYRISTSNYSSSTAMIKNECLDVVKNYNSVLFIENEGKNVSCVLFGSNNNKVSAINIGNNINCICEK